jgi:outer membrane lipoprotein SlyB
MIFNNNFNVENNMRILKLAVGLVVLFGLVGCSDMKGRDIGTIGGAGVGAALGSQVGGGNAGILGAAGGAVVGGLVGRSVGKSMEGDD